MTADDIPEAPREGQLGRPAVAFLATGENVDHVVGGVLRAKRHGHVPLIVTRDGTADEAIELAGLLGVETISLTSQGLVSDVETTIATRGRELGVPGVVYYGAPDGPVDVSSAESVSRTAAEFVTTVSEPAPEPAPIDVLVAIPAYNEASRIGEIVQEARQYSDAVVVIDDGSSDETATIAREAGATVIEHGYNRGYGAAIGSALRVADEWNVEYLITIDGDGQHDPADISRVEQVHNQSDADIVIGSRFDGGQSSDIPPIREFGIRAINTLLNATFRSLNRGAGITDTQSGFRSYNRDAIRMLTEKNVTGDMGASIYILYFAAEHGLSFDEVGINVDYDVEDPNTMPAVTHGQILIRTLFRIVENDQPIFVLAVPGLLLVLVGVGFGYWTTLNYLQTATFPLGLSITAVFFTLVGLFATFTGILLHALNRQRRST